MPKTALAFVGSYFVLLLLAFVRHPIYGLFAYLLAFYVHPPSRWWGGRSGEGAAIRVPWGAAGDTAAPGAYPFRLGG